MSTSALWTLISLELCPLDTLFVQQAIRTGAGCCNLVVLPEIRCIVAFSHFPFNHSEGRAHFKAPDNIVLSNEPVF